MLLLTSGSHKGRSSLPKGRENEVPDGLFQVPWWSRKLFKMLAFKRSTMERRLKSLLLHGDITFFYWRSTLKLNSRTIQIFVLFWVSFKPEVKDEYKVKQTLSTVASHGYSVGKSLKGFQDTRQNTSPSTKLSYHSTYECSWHDRPCTSDGWGMQKQFPTNIKLQFLELILPSVSRGSGMQPELS